MLDAVFVVAVGFGEEGEIAFEAFFAFVGFDCAFHSGGVGGEGERFAIVEEELVVGLRFHKGDAFRRQRGSEVGEGLVEHAGKEK